MDEQPKFTLAEWRRIAKKRREGGIDSLTEDEREILEAGWALADRIRASMSPETRSELRKSAEAYERIKDAYESLPPDDQMRYQDWPVEELEVFLPLIVAWREEDS